MNCTMIDPRSQWQGRRKKRDEECLLFDIPASRQEVGYERELLSKGTGSDQHISQAETHPLWQHSRIEVTEITLVSCLSAFAGPQFCSSRRVHACNWISALEFSLGSLQCLPCSREGRQGNCATRCPTRALRFCRRKKNSTMAKAAVASLVRHSGWQGVWTPAEHVHVFSSGSSRRCFRVRETDMP